MSDLPILFSGPMVRALIAGTKTQTRRVIYPYQPVPGSGRVPSNLAVYDGREAFSLRFKVGDRLYVREHWRINKVWDAVAPRDLGDIGPVTYEADQGLRYFTGKFRQGMHMPKRFSRITLHVTEVRVQRLQEISEEDACAEGCSFDGLKDPAIPGGPSPIASYARLWDAINGPESWDANPWVSATTFEVERCNIAQARAA